MGSGVAASGALVGQVAPCGLARVATRPTWARGPSEIHSGVLLVCVVEAWTQQLLKLCEANAVCDLIGCPTQLDSFKFHLADVVCDNN